MHICLPGIIYNSFHPQRIIYTFMLVDICVSKCIYVYACVCLYIYF